MQAIVILALIAAVIAQETAPPPPAGEPCDESFARRAHPSGDCRRYQTCLNRIWVDKECRIEGHVYNLGYRQCIPGTCAEGGCEKEKQRIVEDPECKAYEICWYDQWLPRKCGGNTIFHEDFQGCFTGTCEDRGPAGEKKMCEKPWEYRADKEDCNKYNICFFNFWVQAACSEGLRFDEARRLCVSNNGEC